MDASQREVEELGKGREGGVKSRAAGKRCTRCTPASGNKRYRHPMLSPVPAAKARLHPRLGRAGLGCLHGWVCLCLYKGVLYIYMYICVCMSAQSAWGLGWGPKRATA